MRHRRQLGTAAVILFSLAAGCKSSDNGTNPGPQPSSLAKAAGDSQAGDAGTTLSTPLQVLVADTAKAGVKGIPVDWVAAGGGSVTASSSVSDTDGIARVSRVLPANAAMVTTTATHAGLTGSPITFTSFSQIAGAFKIVKVAGDSQNDTVGATLANPYQVEVLNYQNAPVASANVTVTATAGSPASGTFPTNGSGIASITRTLGTTAGTETLQAAIAGLIGSPITFTAVASHGQATTLAENNQSDTAGVVGSTLNYGVKATDAHGNPVSGISITWAVVAGGGSNNPTSNSTGVNGVAVTTHTLGSSPGKDTVTATSGPSLTGSPVRFTATILAAPLTGAVTVGPGIVYSPTSVTIASGGTVTWTWANGSVSHGVEWLTKPAAATMPTNSAIMTSGQYQWMFTTAGTYTYDCLVHGAAMSGSITVQ